MIKFNQITNSIQLLQLLKQLFPRFDVKVVAIDKLKEVEQKMKQVVIINFQKSNQAGTHWSAIICHDPRWVIYFDSFAVQPPEEILQFMRRYNEKGIVKDLIMTTKRVQSLKDNYCGWACLLMSKLLISGKKEPWVANGLINRKNILAFGKSLWRKYLKD